MGQLVFAFQHHRRGIGNFHDCLGDQFEWQSDNYGVGTGSTLNVTGKINAWNVPRSGITKEGTGTLVLSGANGYNGVTEITAGTLVAANSSALGESGWSGDNMTWVRDGATLALQGGVSIPDHMHVFGTGVGGLGSARSAASAATTR